MSGFKYQVTPKAGGGFTTRAILGHPITESTFTDQLVAKTGLTAEQCESVVEATVDTILENAANNLWAPDIYRQFGFRPTSGGSEDTPDGFLTPREINANVSISLLASRVNQWRSGLGIEREGQVGLVTPVVNTIISEENGAENAYQPGTLIRLRGTNLRFDKSDTSQGVFFIGDDDTETRAPVYGPIEPSEASVLVPDSLSGSLQVRIAAYINSSVRSYNYTTPLQLSS